MTSSKTAILIDDERYCNETLEFELKRSDFDIQIMAKCEDPREAERLLNIHKPEIVFLDIEMPWMSGFELLDSLDHLDFHLVFVTAYDQFALKAFDYFAINYLLKPVNRQDLNKTIEKIFTKSMGSDHNLSMILDAYSKTKSNSDLIALPAANGYDFFLQSEIIRCEADSNYCTIHFESRAPLFISKSLKMIESLLDNRFFRVHQSHLINTRKLRKLNKVDGDQVVLSDGSKVPLSRMKKSNFIKFIKGAI